MDGIHNNIPFNRFNLETYIIPANPYGVTHTRNFPMMSLGLKFNVVLQIADFKQIENNCSQCTIFILHNLVSFNPFEGAE